MVRIKGASFDKKSGKWQSGIMVHGQRTHLGWFNTEEEAGAAYRKAKAQKVVPGRKKPKAQTKHKQPEKRNPVPTIETTASPYNLLKKGYSKVNHYYVDDKGCTVYYYNKAVKNEEDDDKPKARTVMGCWFVVKQKIHNARTNEYTIVLEGRDIISNKKTVISMSGDQFYGLPQKLYSAVACELNVNAPFKLLRGKDNLQQIITDLTPEGTTQIIKEYDQVVWDNDRLIIPGMEPDGYICNIDKKYFPYDMPEGLDMVKGLKALEYIITHISH